jgi:hypothetical protein
VNESTLNMLRAAEEAVSQLINECRKNGPVYARAPRAFAQVTRTGKWHLNAITSLRKALDTAANDQGGEKTRKRGA